jgi:hypothetical protein
MFRRHSDVICSNVFGYYFPISLSVCEYEINYYLLNAKLYIL